ncbi:uncharacterized protein LOC113854565 [Abrus precatorius]|uniref:Uncharacterized protein LOC113854565 n=1 Tax=Abrus precatorius TaxID=3816 RepID=A0A8B8KCC1_ABRPR|nr:uncharacterized protein LOC113854565 [Abrus precatorius]
MVLPLRKLRSHCFHHKLCRVQIAQLLISNMEKSVKDKHKQFSKVPRCSSSSNKRNMWDCGSTLYDSYELNSFKRQLDSAIANSPINRTLSMPHVPERYLSLQPQPQPQPLSSNNNNKTFKISRPFQKLLRFVFKSGNKLRISSSSHSDSSFQVAEKYSKDRFYVVYDKSEPALSTIPELPEIEIGGFSPEITSFVRKSASERFTATPTIGVSCA